MCRYDPGIYLFSVSLLSYASMDEVIIIASMFTVGDGSYYFIMHACFLNPMCTGTYFDNDIPVLC